MSSENKEEKFPSINEVVELLENINSSAGQEEFTAIIQDLQNIITATNFPILAERIISYYSLKGIVNKSFYNDANLAESVVFLQLLRWISELPQFAKRLIRSNYFWKSFMDYLQNLAHMGEERACTHAILLHITQNLALIAKPNEIHQILDMNIVGLLIEFYENSKFKNDYRDAAMRDEVSTIACAFFENSLELNPNPIVEKLLSQGCDPELHIWKIGEADEEQQQGLYLALTGVSEGNPFYRCKRTTWKKYYEIHRTVKKVCFVCGKNKKVKWCGRCKSIFYCGKKHQRKDWKRHKKMCNKF